MRVIYLLMFVCHLMIWSSIGSAAEKLDDATIFAIFDQANQTDISTGLLGAKQGHSEAVRQLGKSVAGDHMGVQQMGRELAKKLGITPTPPDKDTSIADQAKIVAELQAKSGSEFDKAYLLHEINYHQAVIDAINGTLLPAIKNDEFKKLVNTVLPGFEHHLAETKSTAHKLGIQ